MLSELRCAPPTVFGGTRMQSARRAARCRAGVALAAALVFTPAAAQPEATRQAQSAVTPVRLYETVMRFQLDLEMLRWVVGDPKVAVAPWDVSAAAPRHLFWQAQAMFRKAHELAEEVAGTKTLPLRPDAWRRAQPRPAPRDRAIHLADVLQVVSDAQEHIRATFALENIRMMSASPSVLSPANTGEGDVLAQIVQANRQLNILLHAEVATRDAYNKVMAAVERAGDLLGGHYPPRPPLPAGQTPADVYRRLVRCLALLQPAATARGIRPLGLNLEGDLSRQNVSVADVYHLATTLLADLEYMAVRMDSDVTKPPRGEYPMPRFVFPSHIQQIASVLEAQLSQLASPARD